MVVLKRFALGFYHRALVRSLNGNTKTHCSLLRKHLELAQFPVIARGGRVCKVDLQACQREAYNLCLYQASSRGVGCNLARFGSPELVLNKHLAYESSFWVSPFMVSVKSCIFFGKMSAHDLKILYFLWKNVCFSLLLTCFVSHYSISSLPTYHSFL